jgi:hypothetical protein
MDPSTCVFFEVDRAVPAWCTGGPRAARRITAASLLSRVCTRRREAGQYIPSLPPEEVALRPEARLSGPPRRGTHARARKRRAGGAGWR